jgi:hypothetical protein
VCDGNVYANISMSQHNGMNSIKITLLLFTVLAIVILRTLAMDNDNQTPSSHLFYDYPNLFSSFFFIFPGRIDFNYLFVVQVTSLLVTEIK